MQSTVSVDPPGTQTLLLIAAMTGNFQGGSMPGKIQFGSAWWYNDQKDGMEHQITALANMGLLDRFVGMLTDPSSFLSYPRHEYFRRVLCNLLGRDVENGQLPDDPELIGSMIKDICYNNAVRYFEISVPKHHCRFGQFDRIGDIDLRRLVLRHQCIRYDDTKTK